MAKKENENFAKYVELRSKIRDCHYLQWVVLNEKIIELIQKTEEITPQVVEDIKKAYDSLSEGIILSMYPTDFPSPTNLNELKAIELPLLIHIPQALRNTFNRLFKAYLKTSSNNFFVPEESIYRLRTKYNNENLDLRYPKNKPNPYKNNPNSWKYKDWREKAVDEFYLYYEEVLDLISSIRNFESHREDPFISAQFDLANRKIMEPVSGLESPGNYVVLSNIVILCVYKFIEILQTWIDTQTRFQIV